MDNYCIQVMIILNAIGVLLISISLSLVILDSMFDIKKRIENFIRNIYVNKWNKDYQKIFSSSLPREEFEKELKKLHDKIDKFEKFWNP